MPIYFNYYLIQAEPDTDEVFAQVTLLPEPNVSFSIARLFGFRVNGTLTM